MSKMPDEKIEGLEDKVSTSLVETYNVMGITVRFEKRLNIVEINTRGMLTQDVQAQQSIDFNINTKLTSSTETKFIVIPMGEENAGTVLLAIMPGGVLRWRSSVNRAKGTYCTGHAVYFV